MSIRLIQALSLQVMQPHLSDPMEAHSQRWIKCTKCAIGHRAMHHVFARGKLPCRLLFVGEAPGKEENRLGVPFVGASGELLDKWIAYAEHNFNGPPDSFPWYAITNTVLCRPCDKPSGPNRKPQPFEQENCRPRFEEFLKMANPSSVVLLGAVATSFWLDQSAKVIDTYNTLELPHPSRCLRMGGERSPISQQAQRNLSLFINDPNHQPYQE